MSEPTFAKGGVVPRTAWKAGDTAYGIKLDNGYVYVNQATVDHYGLDMLNKINGQVQRVVVAP